MNEKGWLEGRLEEHPVSRVLTYLYDREETGRLVLVQEGMNKTIYTIQGKPVNVESSLRDETLGRYLVKQGKISEEDYERSVELMLKEGIKQGAALVKLGLLKPRELYQEVKAQTRNKILTAFAWEEGEYRFYPETEFIEKIYRFEFSFPLLLKEGIYLHLPESVLERELGLLEDRTITPLPGMEERAKGFSLNEREREFLTQVDGKKSLGELLELEKDYPFARRLLYLFLLAGLLGVEEKLASRIRELFAGEEISAREEVMASPEAPEAELEEAFSEAEEPEEEKESPEKIMEFYLDLKSKNYFQLLGVSEEAGDEEIESGYRSRLEEFSRERFPAQLSPELELKLEEINTEIIKAYEALRTEEKRARYSEQLKKEQAPKVSESLRAEKFLQQGIKYVRQRDWSNAQKMFEKAVELKPEEPEYYGYLGWTIYCNPELEPEERKARAKEKIQKAIQMNPKIDSPHVFLGKILKEEGKLEQAIEEFKTALRCNPNCREARRELKAQGIEL